MKINQLFIYLSALLFLIPLGCNPAAKKPFPFPPGKKPQFLPSLGTKMPAMTLFSESQKT